MKSQLCEYYQCNDKGYVKVENAKVDHLPIISEIPISARCNQILPYKLHKIEVLNPIEIDSDKIIPKQPIKETQKLISSQTPTGKKQTTLNYSFSVSQLGNYPNKMLEKDQVRSIHIDDKTSARTKIEERDKDLTKSTFTYLNKPKIDMKRSLFETNQSYYTNDTINKDSEKLDMIVNQLVKEKKKREEFEKKYEILFNLVNRPNNTHSSEILQQTTLQQHGSPSPTNIRYPNKKRNHKIKSETENSQESGIQADESPVMIKYQRSKNKRKHSSPIIINLGSDTFGKSPVHKKIKVQRSDDQLTDLNEIKSSLQMIHNQVTVLHENVDYLEKKIDEQEMRRQKQALLQQLRDKEQRIEQMTKENQKIKEINQLLVTKKIEPEKIEKSEYSVHLKFEKNTILTSIIITLLMGLLFLAFKESVC